jgi:aminopeptidase YwaD
MLKSAVTIILLFTGTATYAQTLKSSPKSRSNVSQEQDSLYARSVVNTLASPAFKGRGYVEDGDKKTASFIKKEFTKSGLKPIGDSYYQNYNLSVNTFPGRVSVVLDGQKLETAKDYLISASSPSVKGTFKLTMITRAEINTQESLGSLMDKIAGTFIILDNRSGKGETATQVAAIRDNLSRMQYDENLNLRGLIIYSDEKLTWTTSSTQSVRPVIILNKPGIDLTKVKAIDLDIEAKFIPEYGTQNIVGMVKGTSTSDSSLVVTAHYDHLGLMGKEVYFPGANDNASGIAMLLSLAKYYAVNKPLYDMVFIAFSGEEIGLLGSQAFVENPLIDLQKIKFLVNFDLAGTGEEGIKVVNGTFYKNKFDQLTKLNAKYSLLPKVEIRGESCNSDHCFFYEAGVPAIFIYTQGGIKAYHDIYDKAETLPLTEFVDYLSLMKLFFKQQ